MRTFYPCRLTAAPRFWCFLVVPGCIYIIDKIATLRTRWVPECSTALFHLYIFLSLYLDNHFRYMELDILETELLPSDVVKVKFYRPPNMKVLSGQWIRFTCTAIQPEEYHSFTLTSAPHEDFLSVHVKVRLTFN